MNPVPITPEVRSAIEKLFTLRSLLEIGRQTGITFQALTKYRTGECRDIDHQDWIELEPLLKPYLPRGPENKLHIHENTGHIFQGINYGNINSKSGLGEIESKIVELMAGMDVMLKAKILNFVSDQTNANPIS